MTTVQDAARSFPLVLGGNVFGWTADEQDSFAVLDAFVDAGGVMIDTADMYSVWHAGNTGGESESIIGRWLKRSGRRDQVHIATKVAKHPALRGLAPDTIRRGVEGSLRRLGIDHIDLYYAHEDDETVPVQDVVDTFGTLMAAGTIGAIGLSQFAAERIEGFARTCVARGVRTPAAATDAYNLMDRSDYEAKIMPVLTQHDIAGLPFYGLARGFLTGKYRAGEAIDSPRAEGALSYLNQRGRRVLAVLDDIADAHATKPASVALSWLRDQTGVAAPIASARNVEQLQALLASVSLVLHPDELGALSNASKDTSAQGTSSRG